MGAVLLGHVKASELILTAIYSSVGASVVVFAYDISYIMQLASAACSKATQ